MLTVSEATFTRQVLRAPLPVLVCFGQRACPGRRAMLPAIERAAEAHAGRLLVASALLDQAPLLAELYGVDASPTLVAFHGGEPAGRAPGFMPPGLVALFASEVALGAATRDSFWSPVEEQFEDAVLIPLIEQWGLSYQRQAACPAPRGRGQRGRIDLLLHAAEGAPPISLIESKRQIRGNHELQLAVRQAAGYAGDLSLPSFAVAAPRGLWVYRRDGARPVCVQHYTGLELHEAPERPRRLLLHLAGAAAPGRQATG